MRRQRANSPSPEKTMRVLTRFSLFAALLLSAMNGAQAQSSSNEAKPATGSVTGRATVSGKPVAGVGVMLMSSNYFDQRAPLHKGTTDIDGKFKIDRVPAARYYVRVL